MSKNKITTLQSVIEKNDLGTVEVLQPSLESVIANTQLTGKEQQVLLGMAEAVKNSKKSMYEVMYYSGIISRSTKLLEKLHYKDGEFGKFCYDYFGFDKSKASKYAKVGRLFMVQDKQGNTAGEIHSVFANLDELDNYDDYTPTQLVEMLLPDDLTKRGIDPVVFWNSVIDKYGKSKMKVSAIRDFISLLKYVVDNSTISFENSTILQIEMQAKIISDNTNVQPTNNGDNTNVQPTNNGDNTNVQPTNNGDNTNVQPTNNGDNTNVQPTNNGDNTNVQPTNNGVFEMPKPEEYSVIELLEMLSDKIDDLKQVDVKEIKKYQALIKYFKSLK